MRYTIAIYFLISGLMVSCMSSDRTVKTSRSHKVVIDGKEMLVGLITQDELFREFPVFKENYDLYTPAADNVKFIKAFRKKIVIEAYLGTWCGDTRENLPIFLKVLDQAANRHIQVNLRAVDRTKIDPEKTALRHTIVKVPTMIFLYQDKEFARFVEVPEKSVEEDMVDLLKKCPE